MQVGSDLFISALLSLVKFMRRTQAATTIQKYQRMYVEKKRYRQKQAAALVMQTILRAYMARQKYQAVRDNPQTTEKYQSLIDSAHLLFKYPVFKDSEILISS